MNRNVGESMKNKTGMDTLRTAVILFLMITLALTSFCVPAFAAEDPPPESGDGDACFCKKTGGKNRRKWTNCKNCREQRKDAGVYS